MTRSWVWLLTGLSLMASSSGARAYAADAPFDAGPTQNLNLAFGKSLPVNLKPTAVVDWKGPSRVAGGETIHVHFSSPRKINSIKLNDFSRSGKGQTLIHDVEAVTPGDDGNTQFALGELFDFNLKGAGLYDDRDGRVFLNPNGYVSTVVGKVLDSLSFQVEGFGNDDSTLFIEIAADQPFNYYDFKVHRSGAEQGGGGASPGPAPKPYCPGNDGSSAPPATQGLKAGYYSCTSSYIDDPAGQFSAMSLRLESVLPNNVAGYFYVSDTPDIGSVGSVFNSSCDFSTGQCSYHNNTTWGRDWTYQYNWTIINESSFLFQFTAATEGMGPLSGSGKCTWVCY